VSSNYSKWYTFLRGLWKVEFHFSIQSEVIKTTSEEAIFGEVEDNGENTIMV